MAEQHADTFEALARIRKVIEERSLELDLGGLLLGRLPKEISEMKWLESINISGNELREIPEFIWSLENLQELSIYHNPLRKISGSISALVNLRTLYAYDIELTRFPIEIYQLKNLKTLSIPENLLSEIPNGISAMKSLEELFLGGNLIYRLPSDICDAKLKIINISGNRFESIPDELSKIASLEKLYAEDLGPGVASFNFSSLTRLSAIGLSGNNLSVIPEKIFNLKKLRRLTLSGNKLSFINSRIVSLQNLEYLDISFNQVSELCSEIFSLKELKRLDISNNQISSISPELVKLPKLEWVGFDDNPVPQSYKDALMGGFSDFQIFLSSLDEETQRLFEAKLLVTGEGKVGKSWALAAVRGDNPDTAVGESNTTWGIDRGEIRFPHPSIPEESISLNSWDFGGQEIYRITHQFFFSPQAIYLLVWNPRLGAEQCRVREWLRTIALRTGGERNLPKSKSKVIIVATHVDDAGGSYVPNYGYSTLEPELRELIVDEISIDSGTGKNIEVLRELIAKHAAELPEMGQPVNKRWATARSAILAEQATSPWIDFSRLTEICAANAVRADERSALVWTYLHQLGRAVWYGNGVEDKGLSDDPILNDTVILDAEWLSRAFVQVLEDRKTREDRGMLAHKRLPEIWTNHGRPEWHVYDAKEYEILSRVMRAFDVALPTRESHGARSLVPQLVPFLEPELPWVRASEAPGKRTIRMYCDLDHGPTGLMARLIAATEPWHFYWDGEGLFWENGIFLKEKASYDNEALLRKHGEEKPTFEITVSGSMPEFLIHELQKTLESVTSFWPGLSRTYKIGCPTKDSTGDFCTGRFKYEAIVRRLNGEIDSTFNCQDCDTDWSARQLIRGFESFRSTSSMVEHLFQRDQILCPRVFLLRPAEKKALSITSWASVIGKRFEITLISELSGKKVASKEFSFTKEWVGYVKPVTRLASLLLTGAALPIEGDWAKEFKEGGALVDKLGGFAKSPTGSAADLINMDESDIELSPSQLAKFAKFLDQIGLNPREAGMDIAQATDGRWLWMSEEEALAYRPQRVA